MTTFRQHAFQIMPKYTKLNFKNALAVGSPGIWYHSIQVQTPFLAPHSVCICRQLHSNKDIGKSLSVPFYGQFIWQLLRRIYKKP